MNFRQPRGIKLTQYTSIGCPSNCIPRLMRIGLQGTEFCPQSRCYMKMYQMNPLQAKGIKLTTLFPGMPLYLASNFGKVWLWRIWVVVLQSMCQESALWGVRKSQPADASSHAQEEKNSTCPPAHWKHGLWGLSTLLLIPSWCHSHTVRYGSWG